MASIIFCDCWHTEPCVVVVPQLVASGRSTVYRHPKFVCLCDSPHALLVSCRDISNAFSVGLLLFWSTWQRCPNMPLQRPSAFTFGRRAMPPRTTACFTGTSACTNWTAHPPIPRRHWGMSRPVSGPIPSRFFDSSTSHRPKRRQPCPCHRMLSCSAPFFLPSPLLFLSTSFPRYVPACACTRLPVSICTSGGVVVLTTDMSSTSAVWSFLQCPLSR